MLLPAQKFFPQRIQKLIFRNFLYDLTMFDQKSHTNSACNSDICLFCFSGSVYHRRIRDSYIRSAIVVTGMVLTVLILMSMLLCAAMPEAPIEDVVYEITSAVATVGLSRGLTPCLNTAGKWIVILTMYLGRIGPLTLGTAVTVRVQKMPADSHLAEEDIMIG